MCKRVNKQAFAVIIAVLALSIASASPAFAAGTALTGTRMPAPPAVAFTGRGIPIGEIIPTTGTQAITGITGQALTGTAPKTINIPVPGTSKSIPLTGTITGSRATGVIIGVNLFTVKFP